MKNITKNSVRWFQTILAAIAFMITLGSFGAFAVGPTPSAYTTNFTDSSTGMFPQIAADLIAVLPAILAVVLIIWGVRMIGKLFSGHGK